MDNEEYLFRLKTVQTSSFRTLIEGLKDVLTDVNWTFDETGVKVLCMDGNHVSLVSLKLEAGNFELYECVKKMTVGINMNNFFVLIKTVNTNDMLTLGIKKSRPNELQIVMENTEKNTKTSLYLKLLDMDEPTLTIPTTEFDDVITMSSVDFQHLCRDMLQISDILHIFNDGDVMKFSCKGVFAERETTITGSSTHLSSDAPRKKNAVNGSYSLKHLNLFTKCTGLCQIIELYLKNDYPLLIKYSVASLGHLLYCLAPNVDTNE